MKSREELRSLKRIFLLLVFVLTICLVSAFFYIYNDTKSDRINDLVHTSEVIKGFYELSFHQWELSLLSLGTRLLEIDQAETRNAYMKDAIGIYEDEVVAFGLAAPNGQVLAFTSDLPVDSFPNLLDHNRTKRSFLNAQQGSTISIGELYHFPSVKNWILPLRMPVRDEQDSLLAINTTAIDYGRIQTDLKKFKIDPLYTVHLVNRDFNTTQIFFREGEINNPDVLGNQNIAYKQVKQDHSGELPYFRALHPISHELIYGVSQYLPKVNHELIVFVPQEVVVGMVFSRFTPVFLVFLILVICSFLLYHYIKIRLKKSLHILDLEKANLKAIIESTDDIINLFDSEYRLIEFNSSSREAAMKTDQIELKRGMNLIPLMVSKQHQGSFKSNLDRALAGEKFDTTTLYPGIDQTKYFQFTYNPVFRDGEVIGVSFFAKDITEVKKYEKQLQELNSNLEKQVKERTEQLEKKNIELKIGYNELQALQGKLISAEKMASLGVMAAGVAHEINNPLNFIKHGTEALESDIFDKKGNAPEHLQEYFIAIKEGVRRSTEIVKSIGHFSRSGGSLNEACDIHEIMDNCLFILSPKLKNKAIDVTLDFAAKRSIVKGNEGRLHQVFTNIISNAEQAVSVRGSITIKTAESGNKLTVTISDNGYGIAPNILSKITDPFFTTKAPGEGTGLGLSITQSIIEEHDGSMRIESIEGKGASFILTFPLASDLTKVTPEESK